MTAIFYHDCETRSPDGRWHATAFSPHNGTILCRDGTVPEEDYAYKYRAHQSQFRFQLLSSDGEVVWERWQGDEDSPDELVVSNRGTLVIRTHGFSPELIVVRSDGSKSICVGIGSTHYDEGSIEDNKKPDHELVRVDTAEFSTAGVFWTDHSFRYFAEVEGVEIFVWRTRHGQRIIVDVAQGALIRCPNECLESELSKIERKQATQLVHRFASRKDELEAALNSSSESFQLNPDIKQEIGLLTGAITICGEARAIETVPDLAILSDLKWSAYSTSTTCLKRGSIEAQYLRPTIYHAMRLMNVAPPKQPCYYFTIGSAPITYNAVVDCRANRLTKVTKEMSCQEVLSLVGPPDFVDRYSVKNGKFYVWPELWEYDEMLDGRWYTTTIKWEEGVLANSITQITTEAALWMKSADRIRKIQSH